METGRIPRFIFFLLLPLIFGWCFISPSLLSARDFYEFKEMKTGWSPTLLLKIRQKEWEKKIQDSPWDFSLRIEFGKFLFQNQLSGAKEQFLKAKDLNAAKSTPYYWLGQIHEREKQYQKALKQYRTATKLSPRFYLAHQRLKEIQRKITALKDHLIEKKKLFVKQPNLMNLILLKEEIEKKKSLEVLVKNLKFLQKEYDHLFLSSMWLAEIYQKKKNPQQELYFLEIYAQRRPLFFTFFRMGKLYYEFGEFAQAIEAFEQASEWLEKDQGKEESFLFSKQQLHQAMIEVLQAQGEVTLALENYEGIILNGRPTEKISLKLMELHKKQKYNEKIQFLLLVSFFKRGHYQSLHHQYYQLQLGDEWLKKLQNLIEPRLKEEGNVQELQLLYGEVLLYFKDLERAEKIFRKILNQAPDQRESLLALSRIYWIQGKQQKEKQVLEKYVRKKTENKVVLRRLAQLYELEKEFGKALVIYEKLSKKGEQSYVEAQKEILLSLKLKKSKKAIRALEHWRKKPEAQKDVLFLLAPLYEKEQMWRKALKAYDEGLKVGISNADYKNSYGVLLIQYRKYRQAKEIYLKVTEDTPEFANAWYRLATLHFKLGEYEESSEKLLRFLLFGYGNLSTELILQLSEKNISRERIATLKGILSFNQESFKQAFQELQFSEWRQREKVFERWVETLFHTKQWEGLNHAFKASPWPRGELWYLLQGKAFFHQKNYAQAKPLIEVGLEKYPQNLEFQYYHSLLLFHDRKYSEAVSSFQLVLEKGWKYAKIYYYLGLAHQKKRKYKEAEREYHQAVQLDPQYFDAVYGEAYVLQRQRKYDEARQAYERALELRPVHPQSLYNYGVVLIRSKKFKEISPLLERLKSMNSPYFKHLERSFKRARR